MPPSTARLVGFPSRAIRDPDLSIEDLRLLICLDLCAGESGHCPVGLDRVAREAGLPEGTAAERLDDLHARGYVARQRHGRHTTYGLIAEGAADAGPADRRQAPSQAARSPTRRATGRTAQARLHGDLLRRPRRRSDTLLAADDDPGPPHPVVAALQDIERDDSGGAKGFQFWVRTILPPEDVEVFSLWASKWSAEYRRMIHKFNRASDEQAIESLLEGTLALVDREKALAGQRRPDTGVG